MTNEPEKVWISFDETIKPTDPPGYWPKGWPAVFKQPRDSGVMYIRARPESGMVLVHTAYKQALEAAVMGAVDQPEDSASYDVMMERLEIAADMIAAAQGGENE